MTISVRLFAELRERFGATSRTVTLRDRATVGDLIAALGEQAPAARPLLAKCMAAIESEYVSQDCPLQDGQEVAVLPPVSGG